jgi:hypothetical protein
MPTIPTNTLCPTCRSLNLRPDTFLETGWTYPTSLQYATIWDNHDNEADARPNRIDFDNTESEGVNTTTNNTTSNDADADVDVDTDFASLNQRLPTTPLKNVLNKEGDNEVPYKYRVLGSLGDIRQSALGCPLCHAVLHAAQLAEARSAGLKFAETDQCLLRFDFKDIETGEGVDSTEIPSESVSRPGITGGECSEASATAQGSGYYECTLNIGTEPPISIYPVFEEGKSEFAWFGGRRIEAEIDYGLVKRWLSSCDTLHPACSEEKQEIDVSLVERIRVIDVVNGCLTMVNVSATRFVALSYVWGDAATLKVTTKNIDEFQTPGALTKQAEQLPNTTKDAMHVVRELGLQYLWTDSLCILQDDVREMAPALRRMDLIYAAAYFTIVAADGRSVAAGLAGCNPDRRRQVPPLFRYSDEMQLLVVLETLPDVLHLCVWSTRLWTLQEALMSRRLLLFTAQGMHFTCSSLRWSEDLKALSETQPPPWKHAHEQMFDFRANLMARDRESIGEVYHIWNMEQWMTMVAESSSRQLGFGWDIENATAGMIAQLEAFYQTKNLYGLPECVLEESLSWSPMKAGTLRRRRNADNEPVHPTWSWSGWVGETDWLVGAQDIEPSEDMGTQLSISKLSKLDAAPVPLAAHSPDATRTLQETFPYLHILTQTTTLWVSKQVESPEFFRELLSFAWGVRTVQNEIRTGIYPILTEQSSPVLAGSLIIDSTDLCSEDETFECRFVQIYSKPQKHGYGKHANQAFYNVLAIKEVGVLENGIPLVERIGHGRILLSETRDLWKQETVSLQ